MQEAGLPMGEESLLVFGKQSKDDLYLHFETLLFKDEGKAFSYPADQLLTAERGGFGRCRGQRG